MTPKARAAAAAGLFLALAAFTQLALARAPVVPSEEHFLLGERLRETGTLGLDGTPSVFRAPGFPAFVALVLGARDAVAPGLDGGRAVVLAHGLLLAAAGAALFFQVSRDRPPGVAAAAGALAAVHPLALALAAVLSYATLHAVAVLAATLLLARAIEAPDRPGRSLAAGLLWGAATLVRPVSLVLPVVTLLLARWALGPRAWPRALRVAALVTLGMALVVGPWTARNHRVSGRLVLVNAQDGFALWGLAAARDPRGGTLEWARLWWTEGDALLARAVGRRPSPLEGIYADPTTANDAFRKAALDAIRGAPAAFLGKAAQSAALFTGGFPGASVGHLRPWMLGEAFSALSLALAAIGLARGLREGRADARTAAAVFLALVAAHAVVLVVPRYTYVRLPLVLIALPMIGGRRVIVATSLAAALLSAADAGAARTGDARWRALQAGFGAPCAPGAGCADGPLSRGEVAAHVVRALESPGFVPAPCEAPRFADTPCAHASAAWVNALADRGLAFPCGGGAYCPDRPITRAEIAALLLRIREGAAYVPPACVTPLFADADCASTYGPWINALGARGISAGCGGGNYCPLGPVTRRDLSVLLPAALAGR